MAKPRSRAQTPQPPSEKLPGAGSKPPTTTPAPVHAPPRAPANKPNGAKSYASDGVEDNDVFLLPVSDYNIMLALTVVAAAVRLFKIYQPSSVVFDEVQYVAARLPPIQVLFPADSSLKASAASRPSTSRGSSSWTSTRPWPRC